MLASSITLHATVCLPTGYRSAHALSAIVAALLIVATAHSQVDSTKMSNATPATGADTLQMNTDAIYARPFIQRSAGTLAVGGYVEANVQRASSMGSSDGVHFQARRFTMFMAGTPSPNVRFLAELEFENGTEEINLEFASVDFIVSRMLTIRGGIVMIPIGGFNQNHDGPRWNFIDRPISATVLLPATWSSVGMGILGKARIPIGTLSYEMYGTNGLDETIVSNDTRRTSLAAAKSNPFRFAQSTNGHVMISGRTAISAGGFGELGCSYAGGVYSQSHTGAASVGSSLWHHCAAVDYSVGSFSKSWYVKGEAAYVLVDVPPTSEPVYASGQIGGYADVNYTLWRGPLLGFDHGALFVGMRGEYADFHLAGSNSNGANGDELYAATLALAYHPVSGSILRFNYRKQWQTDVLGNDAVTTSTVQLGVTTYF